MGRQSLSIYLRKITERQLFQVDMYLEPEFRKRGIAKQAVKCVINFSKNQNLLVPIIKFHVDTKSILTPEDFMNYLEKSNFVNNYTSKISGVDIRLFDWQQIKSDANRLQNHANKLGFHFRFYHNGVMDSLPCSIQQFYDLRQKIRNDIPSEDADWEDKIYYEQKHEEQYEGIKSGDETVMILAFNQENYPVGISEVTFFSGNKYVLKQNDTGVLEDYRGNRLGITLKMMLINYLKEYNSKIDDIQYWVTDTTGSDIHMIRINELLGYRELLVERCYEIEIDQIMNYLDTC